MVRQTSILENLENVFEREKKKIEQAINGKRKFRVVNRTHPSIEFISDRAINIPPIEDTSCGDTSCGDTSCADTDTSNIKHENPTNPTPNTTSTKTKQTKISAFYKRMANVVKPIIQPFVNAYLTMTFAAIVFTFTQGGKTGYVFELLAKKLRTENRNLVIVLTQSNNKDCVAQTVQRAKRDPNIQKIINPASIYAHTPNTIVDGKSYMLVAFNHKKQRRMLVNFVTVHKHMFDTVSVVIDECDQGGSGSNKKNSSGGVFDRLKFLQSIEDAFTKRASIIFVTATIANMSKCIATILSTGAYSVEFPEGGIVHDILNNKIIEKHYVQPHADYVRASMYLQSNSLKILRYNKEDGISEDEYLLEEIKNSPQNLKKLSLIAITHLTNKHDILAKDLLNTCGYTAVAVLNSERCKDYTVYYKSTLDNRLKIWIIPTSKINALANKGRLLESDIESEYDLSMTNILQSALLMGTDYPPKPMFYLNDPIKTKRAKEEYNKVCALFKHLDRPCDYPTANTKVAMVTGHLASRGITFQNPMTGFTCTSFCVKGSENSDQRGAENTQRIGRACGELMKTYRRNGGAMPYMLCSEGVYIDTLANEETIELNSAISIGESSEHQHIALKDMVTEEMWQTALKNAKRRVRSLRQVRLDAKEKFMLKGYYDIEQTVLRSENRSYFTRDDIRVYSGNTFDGKTVAEIEEEGIQRGYIERFVENGWIFSTQERKGTRHRNAFTQKGKEYVQQML